MKNPIALFLCRGGVMAVLILAFVRSGDAQPSFAWATRMGGGSSDYASSVAIDRNGNTLVVGYFYGLCDFGSTNFYAAHSGYPETFVAKYGSTGNLVWRGSLDSIIRIQPAPWRWTRMEMFSWLETFPVPAASAVPISPASGAVRIFLS